MTSCSVHRDVVLLVSLSHKVEEVEVVAEAYDDVAMTCSYPVQKYSAECDGEVMKELCLVGDCERERG